MVCENIFSAALRLTVADSAFSHKIDYATIFREILNLEGHPKDTTGSQITAILLNRWILPILWFN